MATSFWHTLEAHGRRLVPELGKPKMANDVLFLTAQATVMIPMKAPKPLGMLGL
jgi:hypothetical protein